MYFIQVQFLVNFVILNTAFSARHRTHQVFSIFRREEKLVRPQVGQVSTRDITPKEYESPPSVGLMSIATCWAVWRCARHLSRVQFFGRQSHTSLEGYTRICPVQLQQTHSEEKFKHDHETYT